MSVKASAPCPCGSAQPYASCCGPFHRGEREAPEPEALMRSRYSAFVAGEIDYLIRTLHAQHDDRAVPEAELRASIRHTSQALRYMGLRILDTEAADADGIARVLFCAKVFQRGRDVSFVELSDFAHDSTREGRVGWRYLAGETRAMRGALVTRDAEAFTIEAFRRPGARR